jgi:hypothetical protein
VSTRATQALLAVLAVLGAVAFIVQGPCSADRPRAQEALFPGLAPADVAVIRATRPGVALLLTRDGAAWKLGAAGETADRDAVEALLRGLAEARVAAVVSTNVARQAGYETDGAKGIVVRLEGAGGKLLGAFVVGKSGPDFASCYLRQEGKSEVLLVTRDLRLDLSRPVDSWRKPPEKTEPPAPAPAGAK